MKIYYLFFVLLILILCHKDPANGPDEIYKFNEIEIQQLDSLNNYFIVLFKVNNGKLDTLDYSMSLSNIESHSITEKLNPDTVIMHYGLIRTNYSIDFYKHVSLSDIDTISRSFYNITDFYNFFIADNWTGYRLENLNSCKASVIININYQAMSYNYIENFNNQMQLEIYKVKIRDESSLYIYGRFYGYLHNIIGDFIIIEDAIFKSIIHK